MGVGPGLGLEGFEEVGGSLDKEAAPVLVAEGIAEADWGAEAEVEAEAETEASLLPATEPPEAAAEADDSEAAIRFQPSRFPLRPRGCGLMVLMERCRSMELSARALRIKLD